MTSIDVEPAHQEFLLARGTAIQSYANVEFFLCMLFAHLISSPIEIAAIVFYRIVNTRSRNVILTELLAKRHEKQYEIYWNSIATLLRGLDQDRNNIVHWHTVMHFDMDKMTTVGAALIPPNYWRKSGAEITVPAMRDFTNRCTFVAGYIGGLTNWLNGQMREEERNTWREILQRPVVYLPTNSGGQS